MRPKSSRVLGKDVHDGSELDKKSWLVAINQFFHNGARYSRLTGRGFRSPFISYPPDAFELRNQVAGMTVARDGLRDAGKLKKVRTSTWGDELFDLRGNEG